MGGKSVSKRDVLRWWESGDKHEPDWCVPLYNSAGKQSDCWEGIHRLISTCTVWQMVWVCVWQCVFYFSAQGWVTDKTLLSAIASYADIPPTRWNLPLKTTSDRFVPESKNPSSPSFAMHHKPQLSRGNKPSNHGAVLCFDVVFPKVQSCKEECLKQKPRDFF